MYFHYHGYESWVGPKLAHKSRNVRNFKTCQHVIHSFDYRMEYLAEMIALILVWICNGILDQNYFQGLPTGRDLQVRFHPVSKSHYYFEHFKLETYQIKYYKICFIFSKSYSNVLSRYSCTFGRIDILH